MTRKTLFFIVALFALLFIVQPVAAHGYIIRSIPQDRVVLERAPVRLQYWFSESLEPQFSEINLRNQAGEIIASGATDAEDTTLLSLRVPSDLVDGAYIVELRPAFASDGHVVVESRVFFVGEEVGDIASQAADDTARPLEVFWKALLFHASYLMFGVATVYAYILVPVWGNTRYRHGLLPPRVMRRLNILMGIGLAVALYANIVALLQQTMIFFNVGLTTALTGNLWQVVRVGSRFGDIWHFRMFMLLVIAIFYGAGLFYGRNYPKMIRSFWTANTWAIGLLIGAQAVTSHAAGSLILPWAAIMIHWLHTIAVAFWIGGIATLALILPVALAPYSDNARWEALRPLMFRFSRYIVGTVFVVITSGIYSATNWFYTSADLTTSYGAALAYKLLMVALLLFVGALHHIALRPHLLQRFPLHGLAQWAKSFRLSLRLEMLLVVLALILAAFVSATPIPEPQFLAETVETPSDSQDIGAYTVFVSITPGGTGINTIDTIIEKDGLPIDDVTVEVQFVAPERPLRSHWQVAEYVENGLYVVASDAIDEIGSWQTLIDIFDNDGNLTRAAFAWQISDEATVIESLPASIWTKLALLAVLFSIAFVMYPATRWLAQQMQWTRVNVVISVGIILMTILVGWFSITVIERQEAALQLRLNPPPQIVNTILPDSESLNQGTALYQEYCSAWLQADDMDSLLKRLRLLRDDQLFAITENGWRDLPPCAESLSDIERWHIVNMLRTLRER
ncbi:MAG: CopD family protein [Anaerolineae bacterium]|nr:CopD family protein [Anaerolineae bacterium]MDQ7035214.1 CopD family protein [Anaerolineae bacterium]